MPDWDLSHFDHGSVHAGVAARELARQCRANAAAARASGGIRRRIRHVPADFRANQQLKVLEDQGLLRATGKTIVVFNARPKMRTRPVVVPVKQAGKGTRTSGSGPEE